MPVLKLPSVWTCLCSAQWPDPVDCAVIGLGLQRLVISAWTGLTVVLPSPLSLHHWGLSAGLGFDCYDKVQTLPWFWAPKAVFGAELEESAQVFLMDGIEQTLTNKLGQRVWKPPTWKCTVFGTLLLLGHLERYTANPLRWQVSKCARVVYVCLNRLIRFWMSENVIPHIGFHLSTHMKVFVSVPLSYPHRLY